LVIEEKKLFSQHCFKVLARLSLADSPAMNYWAELAFQRLAKLAVEKVIERQFRYIGTI